MLLTSTTPSCERRLQKQGEGGDFRVVPRLDHNDNVDDEDNVELRESSDIAEMAALYGCPQIPTVVSDSELAPFSKDSERIHQHALSGHTCIEDSLEVRTYLLLSRC